MKGNFHSCQCLSFAISGSWQKHSVEQSYTEYHELDLVKYYMDGIGQCSVQISELATSLRVACDPKSDVIRLSVASVSVEILDLHPDVDLSIFI